MSRDIVQPTIHTTEMLGRKTGAGTRAGVDRWLRPLLDDEGLVAHAHRSSSRKNNALVRNEALGSHTGKTDHRSVRTLEIGHNQTVSSYLEGEV